jgi:hypothetical protein
MTGDLHPTPTRLALLQAVADGAVYGRTEATGTYSSFERRTVGSPARVTARIQELAAAGWTERGPLPADESITANRPWVLTPLGRKILTGGHFVVYELSEVEP